MDKTQTPKRSMLASKLVAELQTIATELGVKDSKKLKKAELIDSILNKTAEPNGSKRSASTVISETPDRSPTEAPAPASPTGTTPPLPGMVPGERPEEAARPQRAPDGVRGRPVRRPEAPRGQPVPASEGTLATSGGASSAPVGTRASASVEAPPSAPSAPEEARPDLRRELDGLRDRDRGRRRRRGRDRGLDRTDRLERPRREYDSDEPGELEVRHGVLDILPEGYGFLRASGYLPGSDDVYVSLSQVRRFQLRRGDEITGGVRRPREGEKYQALVRIDNINGMVSEEIVGRPWFERLTPLYPMERLRMEIIEEPSQITQRIVDLIAPIGKGQRGMIVSPPKAGKTTIMKQIANSVTTNNPECHLIVLLVDERPEEVTDMQRSVKGEIIYSTFDRPSDDHIQVTELTLDRAKRLVELGKDVVILLDGITRLSRAYNLATPASGRILSGGVDSTALYPPKRFFGAARNIEEGGSLTVIATALVETGSRMDEVIFEEFKGTGNWELRLDRRASEKRIFPALDIEASGTRKEELLLSSEELSLVWKLRRVLHALEGVAGLELLIDKMRQTKGNAQFLREVQKVAPGD